MSTAIEFPGTPVNSSANTNNAACVATLAAPGAGFLQYLDGFIVSGGLPGANITTFVSIAGIAGGSVLFDVTAGPALPLLFAYTFPAGGYPASAPNTSIVVTLSSLGAVDMRVVVFGHNIPI